MEKGLIGSRQTLQQRIDLENNEKQPVCLVNALQWALEDLLHDLTLARKVDFESVRQKRLDQFQPHSPLRQKIWSVQGDNTRIGWAYVDAENEIIQMILDEVKKVTEIQINFERTDFGPDDIQLLHAQLDIDRAVGILMIPGHVEKLFPQPSEAVLINKLERNTGCIGGNIVILRKSE